MPSHVVFRLIIVHNHGFPFVIDLSSRNLLVKTDGSLGQFQDGFWNGDLGGWVGPLGPIVLIPQIGHPNFFIEVVQS